MIDKTSYRYIALMVSFHYQILNATADIIPYNVGKNDSLGPLYAFTMELGLHNKSAKHLLNNTSHLFGGTVCQFTR